MKAGYNRVHGAVVVCLIIGIVAVAVYTVAGIVKLL